MSRPWMPLYVADYLKDTGHLSPAEHGAYMLLIMHYWANEKLPQDDRQLARIARMSDREWKSARQSVAPLFRDDWTHKRIDGELAKAAEVSGRRKASADKRWSKRDANAYANASPKADAKHMHRAGVSPSQSQDSSTELSPAALEREFGIFYAAYPKKIGPKDARSSFFRAVKSGVSPEKIIAAATRFREAHALAGTDKQFIPAPAVWLNKGRYDDEDLPQAVRAAPGPVVKPKISNGWAELNLEDFHARGREISIPENSASADAGLRDFDGEIQEPVATGIGGLATLRIVGAGCG